MLYSHTRGSVRLSVIYRINGFRSVGSMKHVWPANLEHGPM